MSIARSEKIKSILYPLLRQLSIGEGLYHVRIVWVEGVWGSMEVTLRFLGNRCGVSKMG